MTIMCAYIGVNIAPKQSNRRKIMNIELHGFLPEHAKKIALAVWSKLSREEFHDSAVTVVSDQSYDHNYRNAPFFRVFSDKKKDFEVIAGLIRPIRMPGAAPPGSSLRC